MVHALTNVKPFLIPPILCSCVTPCWGKKAGSVAEYAWVVVIYVSFDLQLFAGINKNLDVNF